MVDIASPLLDDVARTFAAETAPAASEPRAPRVCPLSAREAEALRLVAQGHSSKAIVRQLFLSPSDRPITIAVSVHR